MYQETIRVVCGVAMLFLGLLAPSTAAAGAEDSRPPDERVFTALGLQPVACGTEDRERFPEQVEVACAATDLTFKEIKQAWRRSPQPVLHDPLRSFVVSWRKTGPTERTLYFLTEVPVAVSFDESRGVVAVRWPGSFPGCHEPFVFEWVSQAGDIVDPRPLERRHPIFPEAARRNRAGGTVIASHLIGPSGRVLDVCVVTAVPRGLGFEQSAIAAYMNWRYEPGTRDGEPVTLAVPVSTSFDLKSETSTTSAVVKAWFDAAGDRSRKGR